MLSWFSGSAKSDNSDKNSVNEINVQSSSSSISSNNQMTAEPSVCPVKHSSQPRSSGGCPVKHGNTNDGEDGVLQSNNQMPILSQSPAPGQSIALPTERQLSTIPRTKTGNEDDDKWVYPSEQQFYNALQRKKFATDERDIASILEIHNEMNERCWQEILKWEQLHKGY